MANSFSPVLYAIDTAFSTKAVDGAGNTLTIPKGSKAVWIGATTAAHKVSVIDSAGTPIFVAVASGANFMYNEIINRDCNNGFTVPTLGSGTLYIYLPSGRVQ
jgi:hypothetical protein